MDNATSGARPAGATVDGAKPKKTQNPCRPRPKARQREVRETVRTEVRAERAREHCPLQSDLGHRRAWGAWSVWGRAASSSQNSRSCRRGPHVSLS